MLYDVLQDSRYACISVIFYTLVVVIGVIGNILVVLTLSASQQTTTATDVFIASLAFVDILVSMKVWLLEHLYELFLLVFLLTL